tara:strand:- start:349 stop:492 length:144 start_codon:yes stop_codon:yes gene_type:complete
LLATNAFNRKAKENGILFVQAKFIFASGKLGRMDALAKKRSPARGPS